MVIKVKGIKAARKAARTMERLTGIETWPYRGEETDRVYWVSNTYLEPLGEQVILEEIPPSSLLYVAGCSHQMQNRNAAVKQFCETPMRKRVDERTKEAMRQMLAGEMSCEYVCGEGDIPRENVDMCCGLSPYRFPRK